MKATTSSRRAPFRKRGPGIRADLGLDRERGNHATLDSTWAAGINAVGLRNSELIRDHSAATFAVRRSDPSTNSEGKAQAIVDDDGNVGGILDVSLRQRGFHQRLGGYLLQRDLAYGETVGQEDIQGAYGLGEVRRGSLFTAFGVECSATYLDRDPLRGGLSGVGAQANFTLRLDRSTSVGAGLLLRDDRPRTSSGEGRQTGLLTAFVSRATDLGTTRLDFTPHQIRPETSPGEFVQSYAWNQDWSGFREYGEFGHINGQGGTEYLFALIGAGNVVACLTWISRNPDLLVQIGQGHEFKSDRS